MKLPIEIEKKAEELYLSEKNERLSLARENLTNKYKTQNATGQSLIKNKEESILYAITRMPATYAVLATLFSQLKSQGFLQNVSSAIDVGSGTGAGYFALKEVFNRLNIKLIEREENMIYAFNNLAKDIDVIKADISLDNIQEKADLVISSYVLNEIPEASRQVVFNKLLQMSNKYVLLVDTGTPKTYEYMMKIKSYVNVSSNAKIVAPCFSGVCPLKNDYCQFYARVERSSLLRQSKSASLSYEDEKYFYLLIEKLSVTKNCGERARIIRRPIIKPNMVELTLCTNSGVIKKQITKKNKDIFKTAKKSKINDLV